MEGGQLERALLPAEEISSSKNGAGGLRPSSLGINASGGPSTATVRTSLFFGSEFRSTDSLSGDSSSDIVPSRRASNDSIDWTSDPRWGFHCSFNQLAEDVADFTQESYAMCFVPQPLPCWLRYNVLFHGVILSSVILMLLGRWVHCLVGQGGPIEKESPVERALRIQWIYQLDAYFCMTLFYGVVKLIVLRSDGASWSATAYLAAIALISFVWIVGNMLGFHAVESRSPIKLKMYICGLLTFVCTLAIMLIAELSVHKPVVQSSMSDAATLGLHSMALAFFLGGFLFYFRIWNLFGPSKPGLTLCACAAAATVVVVLMLLVWRFAEAPLWFLLSGTQP